jgi:hypothetical protein
MKWGLLAAIPLEIAWLKLLSTIPLDIERPGDPLVLQAGQFLAILLHYPAMLVASPWLLPEHALIPLLFSIGYLNMILLLGMFLVVRRAVRNWRAAP